MQIYEVSILYKIIRKENLSTNIYLFEVEADKIAKKAEPGQFIIVRKDDKAERIPLTIADFSRERGTITSVSYTHLDVYKRQV